MPGDGKPMSAWPTSTNFHGGRAVGRAGLHVGRQVAEVTHLLRPPSRVVVVQHFQRAARRDPGEFS